MLTRIISALVALPLAVVLIQMGGWAFMGLGAAATLVCLLEFGAMTQGEDRGATAAIVAFGLALFAAMVSGALYSVPGVAGLMAGQVLLLLFFLFRTGDMQTVAARAGLALSGVFWAGGLMGVLVGLRFLPDGPAWIYLAFVISFGSDTGGYFAGRFLGKHKLYEKVSPKKTWEGSVGGVVVAVLGAVGLRLALGAPQLELPVVAALAGFGAALGQMGDLAESMLKRSVGVKDSGKIMPGHGGLFDRVDALMFVAVLLFGYATGVSGMSPTWFGQ